jgi:hypothetical protein
MTFFSTAPVRIAFAAVTAILLAGCSGSSGQDSQRSPQQTREPSPTTSHSPTEHGTAGAAEHDHGQQHGSSHQSASPSAVQAMLLTERDIPKQYVPHVSHGTYPSRGPLRLDPACLPIAELIGTDRSVQQRQHPQASVAFTKSHFGPTLQESIIDYGEEAGAVAALERVRRSVSGCDRYRQSTVRPGANAYTVEKVESRGVSQAAATFELRAVGADFSDLFWRVTVTQTGPYLVAVGFRSALGSSVMDLRQAVPRALSKVD